MSIKRTVKFSGQNKSRTLPSNIDIRELPIKGDVLVFPDLGSHEVTLKIFHHDSNGDVEGIEYETKPL